LEETEKPGINFGLSVPVKEKKSEQRCDINFITEPKLLLTAGEVFVK